jgi:hypothetical protein
MQEPMILPSGVVECDGCGTKSHYIEGTPAEICKKIRGGGWRTVGKQHFCWVCLHHGKHLKGRAYTKFVAAFIEARRVK